jgi:hypothetical protein
MEPSSCRSTCSRRSIPSGIRTRASGPQVTARQGQPSMSSVRCSILQSSPRFEPATGLWPRDNGVCPPRVQRPTLLTEKSVADLLADVRVWGVRRRRDVRGHHERYTTLRGLRCASRRAYARARGQFAVAWRAPTRTRRGFTRNRALCRSLVHRLSQAAAPLAPSTLLAEGRPPLRRFGGRILLTGTPRDHGGLGRAWLTQ